MLCVYMNGKVTVVFLLQLFSKNERLFKVRPLAVTYTVKVVVSKKWCEIDTLLLHTTNRKYHMAYRFVPFQVTLNVIRLLQDLSYAVRRTFVRH